MKILLDENIPRKLKSLFNEFQVETPLSLGWDGKKDGELLGMMVLNGFDVFITMDKSLRHQQNLSKFPLMIFLIKAVNNHYETVKPHILEIIRILQSQNWEVKLIEIG
ncbi:MAG: hypothetical protein H7A25_04940 [Leptospiraceae bacterium]|nr:hypothetical protein [Leptospiraceae bacterium]MCP5499224.1 hypothetical protein [Leptospiraceae bacterium]